MQNLLLDCKKIFITFSLLTLIMLVGAESIGIVVECLSFGTLFLLWSMSQQKSITPLRRNICFFQISFSYDKIIPVSAPQELLEAASSCFADAEIIC